MKCPDKTQHSLEAWTVDLHPVSGPLQPPRLPIRMLLSAGKGTEMGVYSPQELSILPISRLLVGEEEPLPGLRVCAATAVYRR